MTSVSFERKVIFRLPDFIASKTWITICKSASSKREFIKSQIEDSSNPFPFFRPDSKIGTVSIQIACFLSRCFL